MCPWHEKPWARRETGWTAGRQSHPGPEVCRQSLAVELFLQIRSGPKPMQTPDTGALPSEMWVLVGGGHSLSVRAS